MSYKIAPCIRSCRIDRDALAFGWCGKPQYLALLLTVPGKVYVLTKKIVRIPLVYPQAQSHEVCFLYLTWP